MTGVYVFKSQSRNGPTSCWGPSLDESITLPHDRFWLMHAAPQLANLLEQGSAPSSFTLYNQSRISYGSQFLEEN